MKWNMLKGGIRLSLAYWTSLYSSRVCGLFVKRNNNDSKDGIINPPGIYLLSLRLFIL